MHGPSACTSDPRKFNLKPMEPGGRFPASRAPQEVPIIDYDREGQEKVV